MAAGSNSSDPADHAGGRGNLTAAQARSVDRIAVDEFGMHSLVLMENAGLLAALRCLQLRSGPGPVLILCGPGNNGGDGLVVARQLALRGVPTRIVLTKEPGPGDCLSQLEVLRRSGHTVSIDATEEADLGFGTSPGPALIVDALLGTGFQGDLRAGPARLLARVSAGLSLCAAPVVALDLPSGMDCDTGQFAEGGIPAQHTLTFTAPKRAFLRPETARWTGQVEVLPIGCPRVAIERARESP